MGTKWEGEFNRENENFSKCFFEISLERAEISSSGKKVRVHGSRVHVRV